MLKGRHFVAGASTLLLMLLGVPITGDTIFQEKPEGGATVASLSYTSRWFDHRDPDSKGNAYIAAAFARETIPRLTGTRPGSAETDRMLEARLAREWSPTDLSAPIFPKIPRVAPASPDPQCLVTSNQDLVMVAFRGTEAKWRDILTDANCRPMPFSTSVPGKVHGGFRDAIRAVSPEIIQVVTGLRRRQDGSLKTVCFAGHSLGGALAQLAALELRIQDERRNEPRAPIFVYSFGSPKVGDRLFCAAFDTRIPDCRRFIYSNDIVPRLPPAFTRFIPDLTRKMPQAVGWFPEFTHAGRLEVFGVNYQPISDSRDRELWHYGGGVGPWLLGSLRPGFDVQRWYRELLSRLSQPCADHSLSHYLQASYHRARTAGCELPTPMQFAPWRLLNSIP